MTYRTIAEAAGTSAQYVSMLAKEKRSNPALTKMQKISAALGKSVDQVFPFGGSA